MLVWYRDRYGVLRHAAALASEGLVLEFGTATGSTIRCLAESPAMAGRRLYGFDSFQGLPEPWGPYRAGHFACTPPQVPDNVSLVIGLFHETLPEFLAEHPGSVALVHLDCDLYSSVKYVLETLVSRIVADTVIVMDEYFCVVEHEQRAFREWVDTYGRLYRLEARSVEQLCVVIDK